MQSLNSDLIVNDYIKSNGKFEFNAKTVFLTYTRCPLPRWIALCKLHEQFGHGSISQWCIGREPHSNDGWHLHIVLRFSQQLHVRDVRKFDIGHYHPNIRKPSEEWGLVSYISKHCKTTSNWIISTCKSFRAKQADAHAWANYREYQQLVSPFPFELPNEVLIRAMPECKRRHYWFKSRPDWGKSTWANDTFKGKRVFCRPAKVKYPFEEYVNEEIILYDDVYPDGQEELCAVSQVHQLRTQIYGESRYHARYWPKNTVRMIIVLHNRAPEWEDEDWFKSRFIVVRL